MGEKSLIEWCDASFSPWMGCTWCSAGCGHCYAKHLVEDRFGRAEWGDNGSRTVTAESGWKNVLACDRRSARTGVRMRVFSAHLADLFDPWEYAFTNDLLTPMRTWLLRFWALVMVTPHLDWLLLTKRARRMREFFEAVTPNDVFEAAMDWEREYQAAGKSKTVAGIVAARMRVREALGDMLPPIPRAWPLPNVALGVSVEDQAAADERIPELLQCPAAVRFLSCEPLLGPVDLGLRFEKVPAAKWWPSGERTPEGPYPWESRWVRLPREVLSDWPISPILRARPGIYRANSNKHGALSIQTDGGMLGIRPDEFEVLPGVNWVICGGESGHGARPMHPDWARSLRDQCAAAGVPFFFKQWGEWLPHGQQVLDLSLLPEIPRGWHDWPDGARALWVCKKAAGRLLDGEEFNAFPEWREVAPC